LAVLASAGGAVLAVEEQIKQKNPILLVDVIQQRVDCWSM
jgi:hypothetical protein